MATTPSLDISPRYSSGLGNELSSEAVAGALPLGRNSPQRVPFGLYAEQVSGTAFTLPRHESRRSWLYRIRPSALHGEFTRIDNGTLCGPLSEPTPNRLRWDPLPVLSTATDFLAGLFTVCATHSESARGRREHSHLSRERIHAPGVLQRGRRDARHS